MYHYIQRGDEILQSTVTVVPVWRFLPNYSTAFMMRRIAMNEPMDQVTQLDLVTDNPLSIEETALLEQCEAALPFRFSATAAWPH